MTYDGTGQLDKMAYPNGLVADYGYDALDQLTSISLEDPGVSSFGMPPMTLGTG